MFDEKTPCLVLCLLAFSILVTAQDKDDKDKSTQTKKSDNTSGYIHVEGKSRCDKPGTVYSIDVPDRPGHALMLEKRKCSWTEPLVIKGAKTKDGEAVTFSEKMEGALHVHGFEVDSLDNGEKLTWQSMGQVLGEKGPAAVKGRWSLMRGSGKFKGAKGGGTYEGNLDADGVLSLEFEGVYDPTEMIEQKN